MEPRTYVQGIFEPRFSLIHSRNVNIQLIYTLQSQCFLSKEEISFPISPFSATRNMTKFVKFSFLCVAREVIMGEVPIQKSVKANL